MITVTNLNLTDNYLRYHQNPFYLHLQDIM
jgi:hypothetical protein